MQRHPEYTVTRIRQLIERIHGKIYSDTRPLTDLRVSGPVGRISYDEAQNLTGWRPATVGESYGPVWSTFWFKASATVPAEWAGQRVDLLWDTQSEATLWVDGKTAQGLNTVPGDRPDAVLTRQAKPGEPLQWQIEMACNNLGGIGRIDPDNPPARSPYYLHSAKIALFNPAAWDLFYDAITLCDLMCDLQQDGDISEKSFAGLLLAELNRFCNEIDVEDATTWPAARKILSELFKYKPATRQMQITAIGHAHIDTAWLWPLDETRRKCERSFSTATAYMDDYPDYRFACSQAYQYDLMKRTNPDLYARIKSAVKAGQWNVVGGTWIEPDCNIPSGEALCRQFLVGQRFFKEEFGFYCREFFNPDVFGYNGQLPQIMNLCGIKRFLTQKLSWNRFNKPEHHTFMWQGIDGSEVLAHFPPTDTYNAFLPYAEKTHVAWLRENATLFRDHDRASHGMMLYGWGDGGGGPTKAMLETLKRTKVLQGLPHTEQRSCEEFFTLLEKDITDRPVQIGELYFEYHRGTYTSQARIKKNNRLTERLLHDIEFAATRSTKDYPHEKINELWKLLLLNQFHDILPGSSITEVYRDSEKQFDELFAGGERLLTRAIGAGQDLLNTIGFARIDVVETAGRLVAYKCEPYATGVGNVATDVVSLEKNKGQFVLKNSQLTAKFASTGELLSLVEHGSGRETLAAPGNQFEIYDDQPTAYDAWDIDPYHLETRSTVGGATSAEVVSTEPLRGQLRFTYDIGQKSKMIVTVRLDAHAARLEFHCKVDWQEKHKLLKVAFPINVRSMNATYDMQFGSVERPTHFNTTFDLARYEVPFHKWFDLSEHGFGCALLSDCKYGASTFDNTMRISLLRAPTYPDPICDIGDHEFAYAVMPHVNGWREAGVVAEAHRFNNPLRPADGGSTSSFVSCDDRNLVVDTIKQAEEGDAIVVRMFECHGGRGIAKLTLPPGYVSARVCNVLEESGEVLAVEDGRVDIVYRPSQIISLLISR